MSESTELARISAELDAIGSMPLRDLSNAELREVMAGLRGLRAELLELESIAVLGARPDAVRAMGCRSVRQVLTEREGVSRPDAAEPVTRAWWLHTDRQPRAG
ncbi:hypothetical protein [Flindersiella endophytica]